MLTAILPETDVSNARNLACEKETVNRKVAVAYLGNGSIGRLNVNMNI